MTTLQAVEFLRNSDAGGGGVVVDDDNFKPYTTRTIQGDGSCLFRAIAYAMYGSEDRHLEVRREIVNHVVRNWRALQPGSVNYDSSAATHNPYASAESYRSDMLRATTMGGYLEVLAASAVYPYRFTVYRDGQKYFEVGNNTNYPMLALKFSGELDCGHFDVYTPYTQPTIASNSLKIKYNYFESVYTYIKTKYPDHFERIKSLRDLVRTYMSEGIASMSSDTASTQEHVANFDKLINIINAYYNSLDVNRELQLQTYDDNVADEIVQFSPAPSISSLNATATTAFRPSITCIINVRNDQFETFNWLMDVLTVSTSLTPRTKNEMIVLKDTFDSRGAITNFHVHLDAYDFEKNTYVQKLVNDFGDTNRVTELPRSDTFDFTKINFSSQPDTVSRSLHALAARYRSKIPYDLFLAVDQNEFETLPVDDPARTIIETYNNAMRPNIRMSVYDIINDDDNYDDYNKTFVNQLADQNTYVDQNLSNAFPVIEHRTVSKRLQQTLSSSDDLLDNDEGGGGGTTNVRRKRKRKRHTPPGFAAVDDNTVAQTFVAPSSSPLATNRNHYNYIENYDDLVGDANNVREIVNVLAPGGGNGKRSNSVPLIEPKIMPLYLLDLIKFIPKNVNKLLITCPTSSLATCPSADNYEKTLNTIGRMNLDPLTGDMHFDRIIEPIALCGARDESHCIWFLVNAGAYFVLCARNFFEIRNSIVGKISSDANRATIFIIKYNFLWHYRRFVSELSSNDVTTYKSQRILNVLRVYDTKIQQHYDKLNLRLKSRNTIAASEIILLMLGIAPSATTSA